MYEIVDGDAVGLHPSAKLAFKDMLIHTSVNVTPQGTPRNTQFAGFTPRRIFDIVETPARETREVYGLQYSVEDAGGVGWGCNGVFYKKGEFNGKSVYIRRHEADDGEPPYDGTPPVIYFKGHWKISNTEDTNEWYCLCPDSGFMPEPPIGQWSTHGYDREDANPPPKVIVKRVKRVAFPMPRSARAKGEKSSDAPQCGSSSPSFTGDLGIPALGSETQGKARPRSAADPFGPEDDEIN